MHAAHEVPEYPGASGSSRSKGRSTSGRFSRTALIRGSCSTTVLAGDPHASALNAELSGFQPGSPASSSLLPSSEEWMAIEAAGLDGCYLLEDNELDAAANWPFLHNSSSGIQGPQQQQQQGAADAAQQQQQQQQQLLPDMPQQQRRSAAAVCSGATSPNVSSGTTTGMQAFHPGGQQQQQHMRRPHSYEQLSAEQVHMNGIGRHGHPPSSMDAAAAHDPNRSYYSPPPCQPHPGSAAAAAARARSVGPGLPDGAAAYNPHAAAGIWPHSGPPPPRAAGMMGTAGSGASSSHFPGSRMHGPGSEMWHHHDTSNGGPPMVPHPPYLSHSSSSSHFGSHHLHSGVGRGPGGSSSYAPAGSAGMTGRYDTSGRYDDSYLPGPSSSCMYGGGGLPPPGAGPYHHHMPPGAAAFHPHGAPCPPGMGPHYGPHSGMPPGMTCGPPGHPPPHQLRGVTEGPGGSSNGQLPPSFQPGMPRGPGSCDLLGCLCDSVHAPPVLSVGPVPPPFPPGAAAGPAHHGDVFGSFHAASGELGYHSHHYQHQHLPPPHHLLEDSSSTPYPGSQHPPGMGPGLSHPAGIGMAAASRSSRDPRPLPGGATGRPGGFGDQAMTDVDAVTAHDGMAHPGLRPLRIGPQTSMTPPAASLAAAAAAAMVAEVSNAMGVGDCGALAKHSMDDTAAAAAEAGSGQLQPAARAVPEALHQTGSQLGRRMKAGGSLKSAAMTATPAAEEQLMQGQQHQHQQAAANVGSSWELPLEPGCMSGAAGHELVTAASAAELFNQDAAAPAVAPVVLQLAAASSGSGSDATIMEAADAAAAAAAALTDPAAAAAAPVDLSLLPGHAGFDGGAAAAAAADAGSLSHLMGRDAGMAIEAMAMELPGPAAAAAELAALQQDAALAAAAVAVDSAAVDVTPGPAIAAKKGPAKGKIGSSTSSSSKKSPAAAAAAAGASSSMAGHKRKNDQSVGKGGKAAKTESKGSPYEGNGQPKVQRYMKDMMELRQQFNSLRTTNTQIKVQVLSLQLSKTELLSRLADLTNKWRSTVADNVRLQQENTAVRAQISQVQEKLMSLPPRPQQQPGSPRPRHQLPWLQQRSRCDQEVVPRAHSV